MKRLLFLVLAAGCGASDPGRDGAADMAPPPSDASPDRTTDGPPPDVTVDGPPADRSQPDSSDATGDRAVPVDMAMPPGDVVAEGPPPAALAGGFVVTATLEREAPDAGVGWLQVPARDVFTIYVAQGRLVASRDGSMGTVEIQPEGTGWRTSGPFAFGAIPSMGDCQRILVEYQHVTLTADGAGLRGAVRGRVTGLSGGSDVLGSVPFRGTFTAVPDRDAPRFVPDHDGRPHPLDVAVGVSVSEALPVGTTARLEGSDGSRVALRAADPAQPPARFVAEGPLRQAVSYRLVVEPRPVDLAGNAAAPTDLPGVTALAIPLVPEDGFEGATTPLLQGQAALVGADRYPPIAGQRSLFFPHTPPYTGGGHRLSARLKVDPGDRFVRATVRIITLPSRDVPLTGLFAMQVVGPTGMPTSGGRLEVKPPLVTLDPPPFAPVWGAPQAVEIPLPAGVGNEVLVDMHRPVYCGLSGPSDGALIDDLRVE